MAHFQNDELEYVDEYMNDFQQGNPFGDQFNNGEYSDVEVDSDSDHPRNDTSAREARNGKDIQGIPWEMMNFRRDKYRERRLKQYKNYENLPRHGGDHQKEGKQVEAGGAFYDFQFNTRLVQSTIVHFQVLPDEGFTSCAFVPATTVFEWLRGWKVSLGSWRMRQHVHMLRNLLWATSKHDVYLMQNYSVMHWSSLLRRGKEVFNVAGAVVPTLKCPGSFACSLSRVQISTMAIKDKLMVAGGFHGELICKYLNRPGVEFCTKVTDGENAITNAVDLYQASNGLTKLMTASNDAAVRVYEIENFACLNQFTYPWCVNNTSVSPDGKLLAVLGDDVDCLLADAQSGKVIDNLKGHLDYSFTSAWHPDGRILATGNQDTTCRLWDVRNLSESLAVLKGRMGAIRSIKFSSDGRFMAMAEPADFVHIYDTQAEYSRCQEIDLFGEIAGISFSPDTEALYVAVADRTYGSLLEFNRKRCNHYLDSLI